MHFQHATTTARWLAKLAERVTLTGNLSRAENGNDAVCCSIGLTYSGLNAICEGIQPALQKFTAFKMGAASRAPFLRDIGSSSPENWVFGGPGQPNVHAMLVLASARQVPLEREVAEQIECARDFAIKIVYRQDCVQLTGSLEGCEHFGFKDGISQPLVLGVPGQDAADMAKAPEDILPAGEFVLGQIRLDEKAALNPQARPCPLWMRNGAFQVIRRMNQDVAGWQGQLERIWNDLGAPEDRSREMIAYCDVALIPRKSPLCAAPEGST